MEGHRRATGQLILIHNRSKLLCGVIRHVIAGLEQPDQALVEILHFLGSVQHLQKELSRALGPFWWPYIRMWDGWVGGSVGRGK